MANTKVTGDLIASGTITAANLVSGTLDTLLNGYLTTNSYATESYVTTAVNNLIDAAPASLDTLNELAAALNDDANFATTVTDSIATKLPLVGGNITGDLSVDTNVLFVDTANDRVGIGTSSPDTKLQINGNGIGSYGTINIKGTNSHIGFSDASGTFKSWVGCFNNNFHGNDLDLNLKTGYAGSSNIRIGVNGDSAESLFIEAVTGNIGFNTSIVTVGGSSPQQPTATPKRILFNNDYSTGTTDDSLKLYLFNLGLTRQGFASGSNFDLQYHSSGNAASQHRFYLNNELKASVTSSGISFPNGNGIDFSASAGGGATSSLLDDYEEGTWTPVVKDQSNNSATAATVEGFYTKTGRVVVAMLKLANINTTGLNSGERVIVTGLPFTSNSSAQFRGTLQLEQITFTDYVLASGILNSTQFVLRETRSNNSAINITVSDLVSGSADIIGTLTYFV